MSTAWEYDRTTVPAVQEYVEREVLRHFDHGWLLLAAHDTEGTEALPATVTFVFKRPKLPLRRPRDRRAQAPTRASARKPALQGNNRVGGTAG